MEITIHDGNLIVVLESQMSINGERHPGYLITRQPVPEPEAIVISDDQYVLVFPSVDWALIKLTIDALLAENI